MAKNILSYVLCPALMKGNNRNLCEQNNREIKTSKWKGTTDVEPPDYLSASKNSQSSNTLINASYNSNSIGNLNEGLTFNFSCNTLDEFIQSYTCYNSTREQPKLNAKGYY